MSSDVDRIKDLLDVADVVGEYVKLNKTGSYFKGLCPFHNEKTPSFIVSPDRGTYHCFGCGASGDVFSFVQEFEGLDFKDALRSLAGKAGVELSTKPKNNFSEKKDRIHLINEEASNFFEKNLKKSVDARKYLKERSVSSKTIEEWRLGFAPDLWRSLFDHLISKNFSENDMVEAGLIKAKDGKRYDTFRGRLQFPIFDNANNIIAFSGRALISSDKAPKYLNTPDTSVFNKSETLYGLNRAGRSIRKAGFVVMVEGQFDLILSHQIGISNTVALSGTAVTKEHIKRLKRITDNILFAFDSDEAGINSAYKASSLALQYGMDVKIAELPEGKDPADCISEGKEVWKRILTYAPHAVSHSINRVFGMYPDDRNRIKGVRLYTSRLIAFVEGEMNRASFIREVAEKLNISDEEVANDVENYIKREFSERDFFEGSEFEEGLKKESNLISKSEKIINSFAHLLEWLERKPKQGISVKKIISVISEEDKSFAEKVSKSRKSIKDKNQISEDELWLETLDKKSLLSYCNELIFRYRVAVLEEKITEISRRIKKATEEKISRKDLSEYQKCSDELNSVRERHSKGDFNYIS